MTEDDSKVCTWCSEETDTLHTCKACGYYFCFDCLYGGMCRNCYENFEAEKRAKMQQLKIKLVYYWLIKLGLKTLELRAYEKLGSGGKFILTTICGRILGIITLEHKSSYNHFHKGFGYEINDEVAREFDEDEHCEYLSNTWFWRPWVKFYLKKGKTPAFYQVLNLEVKQ